MGLWLNGRLLNTDTVDLEGKVELEDWRLRDEAGCITRQEVSDFVQASRVPLLSHHRLPKNISAGTLPSP